jgi:hypothetical protein
MRVALTICVLLCATACGGGTATTTTNPPPQQAQSSGDAWQPYESVPYGIRLMVPNPEACVQGTHGENGHLRCDYGGMTIEVHAIPRRLTISELRDYAIGVTNIPGHLWQWEGERQGANGYVFAEAWSATSGPQSIVGVAGHSGVRMVSHVVFIYGDTGELSRNQQALEQFVYNVHAI